jgi:hypothetical protein
VSPTESLGHHRLAPYCCPRRTRWREEAGQGGSRELGCSRGCYLLLLPRPRPRGSIPPASTFQGGDLPRTFASRGSAVRSARFRKRCRIALVCPPKPPPQTCGAAGAAPAPCRARHRSRLCGQVRGRRSGWSSSGRGRPSSSRTVAEIDTGHDQVAVERVSQVMPLQAWEVAAILALPRRCLDRRQIIDHHSILRRKAIVA